MAHLFQIVLTILGLASATPYETMIGPSNQDGTSWGEWGELDLCGDGQPADGIVVKSMGDSGTFGDDSAINGFKLSCRNGDKPFSSEGVDGDWFTEFRFCPFSGDYMTGFRLKVEKDQGIADDTSVNRIEMICASGYEFDPGSLTSWGDWGTTFVCPGGQGICGIQTKVEEHTSDLMDDTGLTNVKFACCNASKRKSIML